MSATCTSQGYTNHVCSRCGASYATDYTSALGHDFQFSYTVAPAVGQQGYDLYVCSRCGATDMQNIQAALQPSMSDAAAAVNSYIASFGVSIGGGESGYVVFPADPSDYDYTVLRGCEAFDLFRYNLSSHDYVYAASCSISGSRGVIYYTCRSKD